MLLIIFGFIVGYQANKHVAKYGSWSAVASNVIIRAKNIIG